MRAGIGKVLVRLEKTAGEGVFWGEVVDMGLGTRLGMSMRDCRVAFDVVKAERVEEMLYSLEETNILAIEQVKKVAPEELEGNLDSDKIESGKADIEEAGDEV